MITGLKQASRAFMQQIRKPRLTEETSATGTEIFGGQITNEDTNTAKFDSFSDAPEIFDEMMDTEPTLNALMHAIQLPILRAEPRVDPASEDRVDQEPADFLRMNIIENESFAYSEWLRDILDFLIYGFVIREKVFEVRNNKMWWNKFRYMKPDTIFQWNIGDEGLESITQHGYDPRKKRFITEDIGPAQGIDSKLFHIARNQRGDNYRGKSVLRPVYKAFIGKKDMTSRMLIQSERGAVGIPEIEFASSNPTATIKAQAISVAQNLRSDAKAYLIRTPDFKIGYTGGKEFFGFDLLPGIRYLDQQMVSGVMAQFLEQSKDSTGSFAKQQSDIELFLDSLEGIANFVEDVINNGFNGIDNGRQLIDLNFNVKEYPKYRIAKIKGTDISGLSTVIKTLVEVGAIQINDKDEEFLRAEIGLPEVDMKELKQQQQQQNGTFQPTKSFFEVKSQQKKRGKHVTEKLLEIEREVLNLVEIKTNLETAKENLKKSTENFRVTIVRELLNRSQRILSGNKSIKRVSELIQETTVSNKAQLINEVVKESQKLFTFGRKSIRDEMKKMKQGVRMQGVIDDANEARRSIRPTVEAEIDTWFSKLKAEWGASILNQSKTGTINLGIIQDDIDRVSTNVFFQSMNKIATESFGLGRNTEIVKQGADRVIRSEVLDDNTCTPCLEVDGREFNVNSPDFGQISRGPFDDCEGRDSCRGINIPI